MNLQLCSLIQCAEHDSCRVLMVSHLCLHFCRWMLPLHYHPQFPTCLWSISIRQLVLLLWRAGLTAKHTQDYPMFFIQLNYVHNKRNKMLPPYAKLPCHKVAHGIPLPFNQWSHANKHWEEYFGLALQNNSSNCLVLILHRQLGNYLLSTGESYGPTTHYMQDSL